LGQDYSEVSDESVSDGMAKIAEREIPAGNRAESGGRAPENVPRERGSMDIPTAMVVAAADVGASTAFKATSEGATPQEAATAAKTAAGTVVLSMGGAMHQAATAAMAVFHSATGQF
jgi:hypothetical protein